MDSPIAAAKFLLPKVPFWISTLTSHTLGLSDTASIWDLRTEMIVRTIRYILATPTGSTISRQQKLSTRDPGIKGRMHVSKVTLPIPPESDLPEALSKAITELYADGTSLPDVLPTESVQALEAEWTSHNPDVKPGTPRANLSEKEHYDALMRSTSTETTILYFHGGALYLMDPATHRGVCAKLSKHTGGRCFNIRYRLCPQHAFPAALLDCLNAYLALLSPPPGSYHSPVAGSAIVLAGDSAGGNLCLCLLQLLLHLQRSAPAGTLPKLRFHGKDVEVPLPAGLALSSPWTDQTASMPSIKTNLKYDYLPNLDPARMKSIPACDIWPTMPPRADLYTGLEWIRHPLVSPLAAKDWTGSPPVFLNVGTEILTDEVKAVAKRIMDQGTKVETLEWEGMPHCFAQVLLGTTPSRKMFEAWGNFAKAAVEGLVHESKYTYVRAKTWATEERSVQELSSYNYDQVKNLMDEAWEKKRKAFESGDDKVPAKL